MWHWSILEMVRYVEVPRTWKLIERPSSRLLDVLYGRCEYNDSVLLAQHHLKLACRDKLRWLIKSCRRLLHKNMLDRTNSRAWESIRKMRFIRDVVTINRIEGLHESQYFMDCSLE